MCLLISEKRKKYQISGLRYVIKNYMTKAGISLTKHDLNSFRNHYVKECFNQSVDVVEVADKTSLTIEYVSRIYNKIESHIKTEQAL